MSDMVTRAKYMSTMWLVCEWLEG